MKKILSQVIRRTKANKEKYQSLSYVEACYPIVDATLAYFEGRGTLQQVLADGKKLQEQTEAIPAWKQRAIAHQLQFVHNHQPGDPKDVVTHVAIEERLCNVL